MNATIALFGFGIVARIFMMLVSNVFFRHRAQISLQSGSVHVTIPTNITWSPGMHIFLRFAHIRPFESHPFTIASIPSAGADGSYEMVFTIRPETGFTRVLADVAATASPDRKFPVIVDGPYGETGTNTLRAYDSVLLLAGGTGITFAAPLLEDLVHAMTLKDGPCKRIEVFWAVKSYGEQPSRLR
jgi:predicted ferric reductase